MGRIKGPEVNGPNWRMRNRPMQRMNLTQLDAAVSAYDRVLALSSEIRARNGLDPVPDGPRICAARARLSRNPVKLKAPMTPEQKVKEVAKRRKQREREAKRDDQIIRELVSEKIVRASVVAKSLGVSRQRIYQLAG